MITLDFTELYQEKLSDIHIFVLFCLARASYTSIVGFTPHHNVSLGESYYCLTCELNHCSTD